MPQSDRIEFAKSIDANGHKEAGEKLLFFLNRLDETDKATIIGKLLSSTILKQISYEDFLRIIYSVDKMFISDLNLINPKRWKHRVENFNFMLSEISEDTRQSFFQAGLLIQKIKDNRKSGLPQMISHGAMVAAPPEFEYKTNNYCDQLIKYGF